MKRFIYICSPLRGDYENNTENARAYCRIIMRNRPDLIPIAPHIYFPQFIYDTDGKERALGMEAGIALLDKCEEIWVFGINNPSEGMRAEIEYAKEHGIPIRNGNEALADIILKGVFSCRPTANTGECKAEPPESTLRA